MGRALFLAACATLGVTSTLTAAVRPPRLATLLARSRLAAAGTVIRVEEYDHGRVSVGWIRVEHLLKGAAQPGDLAVVEQHDRPSSTALLRTGERVVVFLQRSERTSTLATTLPPGPTYFELLDGQSGILSTTDAETAREAGALVARMVEASVDTTSAPVERAARARALVFGEVSARHPRLVADGASGIGSLADLADSLTDDERGRLEHALQRTDVPPWVRVALVEAVANARLVALAPALRNLSAPTPEILSAAWAALAKLGQPPTLADLRPWATDADPALRAAVPPAMLESGDPDAIGQVEAIALDDPDMAVRRAAVEALGALRLPTVLPGLERIYRAGPAELRPVVGQAFLAVGGRSSAEALARLALAGPPQAQLYAVTILLALVDRNDPLVVELREHHPDAELRGVLEHGPYLGHHHD